MHIHSEIVQDICVLCRIQNSFVITTTNKKTVIIYSLYLHSYIHLTRLLPLCLDAVQSLRSVFPHLPLMAPDVPQPPRSCSRPGLIPPGQMAAVAKHARLESFTEQPRRAGMLRFTMVHSTCTHLGKRSTTTQPCPSSSQASCSVYSL